MKDEITAQGYPGSLVRHFQEHPNDAVELLGAMQEAMTWFQGKPVKNGWVDRARKIIEKIDLTIAGS